MAKSVVKLYSMIALANRLGTSHSTLKEATRQAARGKYDLWNENFPEWVLIGLPRKSWFAYQRSEPVEIDLIRE